MASSVTHRADAWSIAVILAAIAACHGDRAVEPEACDHSRILVVPESIILLPRNAMIVEAREQCAGGVGDIIWATWATSDSSVAGVANQEPYPENATVWVVAPGRAELHASTPTRSGSGVVLGAPIPPVERFATMAGGPAGVCGVSPAGTVYCRGGMIRSACRALPSGQLECGTYLDLTLGTTQGLTFQTLGANRLPHTWSPLRVPAAEAMTTISVGGSHACGLGSDFTAFCWNAGYGNHGELGTGSAAGGPPTPVAGSLRFRQLSAGAAHTCGVTDDGAAYCWGGNGGAQLGDSSQTERDTPTPVRTNLSFIQVKAGYDESCGVGADGSAYCWGSNEYGRLGAASADTCQRLLCGYGECLEIDFPCAKTPVRVETPTPIRAVAVGGPICALDTGGSAYCWGGGSGPMPVAGAPAFVSLEAGGSFVCGLTAAGDVYCWGALNEATQPTLLPGAMRFAALAAGGSNLCGVTADGLGYTWETNTGEQPRWVPFPGQH